VAAQINSGAARSIIHGEHDVIDADNEFGQEVTKEWLPQAVMSSNNICTATFNIFVENVD